MNHDFTSHHFISHLGLALCQTQGCSDFNDPYMRYNKGRGGCPDFGQWNNIGRLSLRCPLQRLKSWLFLVAAAKVGAVRVQQSPW
jgi:hypothetical protein